MTCTRKMQKEHPIGFCLPTARAVGLEHAIGTLALNVDVAKLARDVDASREWLAEISGYRPDLF
jgi:hypothetical protein